MAWKPYIRCPCCGKLASAYALGHAGTHQLEVRQIVKSLGYRFGFQWDRKPLPHDFAGALVRGLAKALVQVLRAFVPPVELLELAQPDLEEALARIRAFRSTFYVAPTAPTAVAPSTPTAEVRGRNAQVTGYSVVGEYHPKERAA